METTRALPRAVSDETWMDTPTKAPPSGRKKRTDYWREQKRAQRERLKGDLGAKFRRYLREEKREQRSQDWGPFIAQMVDGQHRPYVRDGSRRGFVPSRRALSPSEVRQHRADIRLVPMEVWTEMDLARALEWLAGVPSGPPLESLTLFELKGYALAVGVIVWQLSYGLGQGAGRAVRRCLRLDRAHERPIDFLEDVVVAFAATDTMLQRVSAKLCFQFEASGPELQKGLKSKIDALVQQVPGPVEPYPKVSIIFLGISYLL